MDFEKLDSLRKSASIDMKLSEAHGGICSQICFDNDYFEEFVPLDQSDDGASVSVQIGAYRKALLKIIDENGKTLFGWVGGGCAEEAVREAALESMRDGETRIVPLDLH